MDANPYAAPVAAVTGEVPLPSDPEEIRRAHIAHEASVRSVGTLYFLGAMGMTVWTITNAHALITGSELAKESAWGLVAILAVITALQYWMGIGLRRLRKPARAVAAIFSAIGLIAVPIGTVISAYVLYLLMSRKGSMVFSSGYQEVIAATPDVKYKTSKVVWAVLLLFGVVILAFVALGLIAAISAAVKGG
ncbi:hypothetical protein [Luteolibacter luteus]|uniref:Uncharacterized protein n=1 Tax=Luteolibacter luteus TaxID=2728835 RepID=A0A858RST6_9BACT|nr:hypothetical protein [Luteolibacter luteus]QJE99043.1 hypothetical protein HHL09_25770 [Luteolibacter luteus]